MTPPADVEKTTEGAAAKVEKTVEKAEAKVFRRRATAIAELGDTAERFPECRCGHPAHLARECQWHACECQKYELPEKLPG